MEITLEKIELVKDRTGVSYKEAKEILEENEGSVVDAIIAIEEAIEENPASKLSKEGSSALEKVKELIKKGNVSKIVVKKEGENILNIPVNVGIIGGMIAPIATIGAVAASFGFKCTIEVIKEDGSVIDVTDAATEKYNGVVEKGANIFGDVKSKSVEALEKAKEKVGDVNLDAIKEKGSDLVEAGKDKAKDLTEKITSKDEEKESIVINIAEDIENAADAIEEEMAEELEGTVKIVDITED